MGLAAHRDLGLGALNESAAAPALTSAHWYRVARLKPRLAAGARLHRHRYRGQTWYVLHDPASARVHRFTPAARVLIGAMNGSRSVDVIWELARRELAGDAPTQDEFLALLGQLHAADLLAGELQPDVLEALARGDQHRSRQRLQSWSNPLALRLRLVDPGRFLDRHGHLWRRLWGVPGAVLWLALVLPAVLLLPAAWPELTGNLADHVLQADNLVLLALVFPLIKALHELGHASATHARGGEVHDMGVVLLVGLPVPYVDASAANVLRSRWSRALVGAAGMAVELALAAAAFLLWRQLEPGLARALCFNVIFAAGVATLLFNGNPLLRYDAYYILADLLEMPNLAQRAGRAWRGLFERFVLRLPDAEPLPVPRRERVWLLAYGLASLVYRVAITLLLALFVASRFFFVGVLLAVWALGVMVLPPLVKGWRALHERPSLALRRSRVLAGGAAACALVAALAAAVPLPHRTLAEGVVWLDDQAVLRAGAAGEIAELLVEPGSPVEVGTPLIRSADIALQAELARQSARVAELQADFDAHWVFDRPAAERLRQLLGFESEALRVLQARIGELVLRAAVAGVFFPQSGADAVGRHHRKGDVLGHVIDAGASRQVRVLLPQSDADALSHRLRGVAMRLASEPGHVLTAHVVRQVPAAREVAPSRTLVSTGGGAIAADPRDPHGLKLLSQAFEVVVAPDEGWPSRSPSYGQRVHVRFEWTAAPLAEQVWLGLRRLFLSHFEA